MDKNIVRWPSSTYNRNEGTLIHLGDIIKWRVICHDTTNTPTYYYTPTLMNEQSLMSVYEKDAKEVYDKWVEYKTGVYRVDNNNPTNNTKPKSQLFTTYSSYLLMGLGVGSMLGGSIIMGIVLFIVGGGILIENYKPS